MATLIVSPSAEESCYQVLCIEGFASESDIVKAILAYELFDSLPPAPESRPGASSVTQGISLSLNIPGGLVINTELQDEPLETYTVTKVPGFSSTYHICPTWYDADLESALFEMGF